MSSNSTSMATYLTRRQTSRKVAAGPENPTYPIEMARHFFDRLQQRGATAARKIPENARFACARQSGRQPASRNQVRCMPGFVFFNIQNSHRNGWKPPANAGRPARDKIGFPWTFWRG